MAYFDRQVINRNTGSIHFRLDSEMTACGIITRDKSKWIETNKQVTCQNCLHNRKEFYRDYRTEIEITDSISIWR